MCAAVDQYHNLLEARNQSAPIATKGAIAVNLSAPSSLLIRKARLFFISNSHELQTDVATRRRTCNLCSQVSAAVSCQCSDDMEPRI